MPDLLILIGTLGGLFLFGPIGFIVGPIVCGLFLTVWDIYGATFKEVLPPVKSLHPSEKMPLQPRPENLRVANSCESMIDQPCLLIENRVGFNPYSDNEK
jgi:hypothetical protein